MPSYRLWRTVCWDMVLKAVGPWRVLERKGPSEGIKSTLGWRPSGPDLRLPAFLVLYTFEATTAAVRTFPPTPKGSSSCLQFVAGFPKKTLFFFWDCPSLSFLTCFKILRFLKSALITAAWLALTFLERKLDLKQLPEPLSHSCDRAKSPNPVSEGKGTCLMTA